MAKVRNLKIVLPGKLFDASQQLSKFFNAGCLLERRFNIRLDIYDGHQLPIVMQTPMMTTRSFARLANAFVKRQRSVTNYDPTVVDVM
jgi:hypothetical protein